MAQVPVPDWQVRPSTEYATYEEENTADAGLGVSLLIPLDNNGKNNGEFRLHIFGGEEEEVCVPAADVYYDLPPQLAGSMLHFPCSSAKTLIPANCTACPWQDANTLIRKVVPLKHRHTPPLFSFFFQSSDAVCIRTFKVKRIHN